MAERRKYHRFPLMEGLQEEVMLYLSPPLIQDPVPVVIRELSAGGMGLETKVAIPSRFLFTIVFSAAGMKKIFAEGKAVHVLMKDDIYCIGVEFVNIDPAIINKINRIGIDAHECTVRIQEEQKSICKQVCRYRPICHRKVKKK